MAYDSVTARGSAGQVTDGAERLPRLVLTVMTLSVFVAITTEVMPVGLLPVISTGLHVTRSRVGLLVSVYALVVCLGSVPLTALLARWTRRRVLTGLLVGYAVSNALFAAAPDYWVALVARVAGGVVHAAFFSVVFAAAVATVRRELAGRALSFVNIGGALAFAAGVPLGTAIGTAVGWRWAFFGGAAVLGLLAWAMAVVMPHAEPPALLADEPVLRAVRRPALLAVTVSVMVLTLGHYTAYTYVTELLAHAGVSQDGVSPVLAGFGCAGIAGLLLARRVVDVAPIRALQWFAFATALVLTLVGVCDGSAVATVAGIVAWGVAFGGLPTLSGAAALRASPQAPDAAPAVVNAAFNVGIAGGAFLGSRELLVAVPAAVAFTGAALTVLASAVLAVVAARARAYLV